MGPLRPQVHERKLIRCESETDGQSPDERAVPRRVLALPPTVSFGCGFLYVKEADVTDKLAGKTPRRKARWSTRQLTMMALFIALGVILSLVEFPLIPGIEFLKYDASTVPALMAGFTYGPGAGCLVGVLVAWIHVLFTGNYWGAVMNSCMVIAYVLPIALIYRQGIRKARAKGRTDGPSSGILVAAFALGIVLTTAVAIGMNLIVTPLYTGMPVEAIITMILPALLPFNLAKALLNSVLGFILLKSLRRFLK
jgi:riboflavin transporter FmnP